MNHLELFARQQASLRRADLAACSEARRAHLGLAAGYAARIGRYSAMTSGTL